MASAFQTLPPPPDAVYPAAMVTNQPPSHSNGSFGMVFVVLAVILVVSAASCALGRLCNKRSQRPSSHQPRAASNNYRDHNHDHRMPPNGRLNERDVEFGFGRRGGEPEPELGFGPRGGEPELGFDGKLPKVKIAPHGESRGHMTMPPQNGEFGGPSIAHQMRTMESPRNFR